MATSPSDVRAVLQVVRDDASSEVAKAVRSGGDVRGLLMAVLPELLAGYTEGSSALAVDWYSELRDEARVRAPYRPAQVVDLDEARVRRTVLWATEPLATEEAAVGEVLSRLTPRVEEEIARGFWDTIEANSHRDVESVGWRRDARAGACPFCRMIADRGAVFRESTARFAAHKNCHCVAVPVFKGGEVGPEATVMQYQATNRRRSAAEQAALREHLRKHYGA